MRAEIDEAKKANDPAILTTPEARLLFAGLAQVSIVTDALASIPEGELRAMPNSEFFAAKALIGGSENDGVVLGARILLREAMEFNPEVRIALDDGTTCDALRKTALTMGAGRAAGSI